MSRPWYKDLAYDVFMHAPYGVIAVVASMLGVGGLYSLWTVKFGHDFFEILHHSHIFFAAVTTVINFRRYSSNMFAAAAIGLLVPPIFCSLSDIVLPYFGGVLLGGDMVFHLCLFESWVSVSFVSVAAVCVAFLMSWKRSSNLSFLLRVAVRSHFLHQFVSASASLFYLSSFGLLDWHNHWLSVFVVLVLAVLLPCLASDLVIPMLCARVVGYPCNVSLCGSCNKLHER